MYVVQETEPGVFTVGFFLPSSEFHPDSDYPTKEEAVAQMRYLNGGPDPKKPRRASPAAAAAAKKP